MDRGTFLKKFPLWLAGQGLKVLDPRPKQRPPGAQQEYLFKEKCTGCDACMIACPHNVIMIEDQEKRLPVIFPEDDPCLLCSDMPCVKSCETGALDLSLKLEPQSF